HLFDKIQQMLLQAVCKLLKLRIEDLDVDTELSEYGFDSITLTDFANRLNQKYKLELTPTVFFEYPTIESFARYLSEEHQAVFAEKFAVRMQSQKGEAPKVEFEEGGEKPRLRSRFAKTMISSVSESKVSEPVAIVGMSGQFPMAGNIEEFWNNLKNEKDCIEEIPRDRWDWEKLYGDPQKEANKTNIKFGGFIEG
ncbi:MAG: hypothetical protein GY755_24285, partial [Chloroflexi bacterium]|nr:hypothetical protein [Chloroflexota bacterium]